MTKKKANTGVAVLNGNLPAVPNTLELLKEELKGLKAITETQYMTDGNIEGVSGFNIQSETKIENLIKAFSAAVGKKAAYDTAAKKLGLDTYPCYPANVDAIEHDTKLRIAVISQADRRAELDVLVKEGESFLTKEDQYQMYLQKVAKAVKK